MSKIRITLLTILALITGTIVSQTCFAKTSLNEYDEKVFSQNDILYYEPCETVDDSSSNSISVCNATLPAATIKMLEGAGIKEKAEQNMERYEYAQNETGVPWQIIAAIHYREGGMDPDKSMTNGEKLYNHVNSDGVSVSADANEDAKKAAELLKDHAVSYYDVDITTDQSVDALGKAFLSYNRGGMYIDSYCGNGDHSYTESPYVMNYFDQDHMGMLWIHADSWCNGENKNSVEGGQNKQLGALTVYAYLCGDEETGGDLDDSGGDNDDDNDGGNDSGDAPASNTAKSGNTAKNISETAIKLAYSHSNRGKAKSTEHDGVWNNAKDEFIEATEALGTWEANHSHGPDCGYFVKAVIATVNPDIVYKSGDQRMDTFRNKLVKDKSKKYLQYWEVIDFDDGDTSKLQSGDIVWGYTDKKHQHYWIAADIDGKLWKAEASYTNKKWGRISGKVGKKWQKYKTQKIFRAKGGTAEQPSCDSAAGGNNNINATGVALAWPVGTKEKRYTLAKGKVLESVLKSPGQTDTFSNTGSGTKAFQKAFMETGMYKNSLRNRSPGGVYSWRYGAYCSGFTATVVRYSGYDKNFIATLDKHGYQQVTYARKHNDLWHVEKWTGEKSKLQGGDILVSAMHSWLIVEDENGELWIAEASLGRHLFGHITKYTKNTSTTTFIIRAKHANNSNVGVSVHGDMKISSTTGTVTNSGRGTGDIGASAIELAWPEGTSSDTYQKKATDKFKNYFSTMDQSKSDSGTCYAGGKSCDRFVGTAVRYSGVDKNMSFGAVDTPNSGTLAYLENTDTWEEVKMDDWHSLDNYKSGDVLIFYKHGATNPSHTAIYAVDSKGKGHIVQASYCEEFGVVKNTYSITSNYWGKIRAFRNKNNGTAASVNCNLCPSEGDDSGDDGTLQAGGYTSEDEADEAVMKPYRALTNEEAKGYYINSGCNGRLTDNCPSFVRYFVNKYTTKKWTATATGNGKDVAINLANDLGLKQYKTPKAYAVFSTTKGYAIDPDTGKPYGHTGVVLGVDTERGKIIIGQAGYCAGENKKYGMMYAKEYDLNSYMDGTYTYIYLDEILKSGALK